MQGLLLTIIHNRLKEVPSFLETFDSILNQLDRFYWMIGYYPWYNTLKKFVEANVYYPPGNCDCVLGIPDLLSSYGAEFIEEQYCLWAIDSEKYNPQTTSLKFCKSHKDETSIDTFVKNHTTVIIDYTEWGRLENIFSQS